MTTFKRRVFGNSKAWSTKEDMFTGTNPYYLGDIMSRVRLRDFLETEDLIFSVVTYEHPSDHYNALLRYIRDPSGERIRNDRRYRKLEFREALEFVKSSRPEYGGGKPHKVPSTDLKRILRPKEILKRIIKERRPEITTIVENLIDEGAALEDLGVTGSHLVGLDRPSSDIDLVAYGADGFKAAKEALGKAIKSGKIREPDEKMWRRIYEKRSPELDFDEFVRHEKRKLNRGMVEDRYFDLLFVRRWGEIENIPSRGEKKGKRMIEARVIDDRFCFDSPAIYEVEHPMVDRVVSYTHTYAGQAFKGEKLQAKGWIEECEEEATLVVGTTRKAEGEWIRSLDLIKNK